ncbi:MAG: glycosyltransferase [Polyangiales bacterium]
MSALPQVDVIILSWNRLDDTLAAIASAREQVDVDHRILIVDQGSEPDNLARLEAFIAPLPNVQLKKLEKNVGVPAGRNIAAAMGTAPYIVALDSDAIFADERVLARAAKHLDDNPQLCAIAFAIINFFTGENDWSSWDYPKRYNPAREFATTRFVGAGHAIRRTTFEAVGGYDDRLMFCGEELDVCYRMINTGQRIVYLPSVSVLHKVAREHRVFWDRGRYFQTVRNAIYSLYKFGTPAPRLALAAGAFYLRGLRNGIGGEAVRGMIACIPMCLAYTRSGVDKSVYRLSPETWGYIRECEPTRSESWVAKLRRQFVTLPTQSSRTES